MTDEQIASWNEELRQASPLEIVEWAIRQADGGAIVSTNFRPYEAVLLHLCTRVQPRIPVLWVDHGYNRAATYQHARQLKELLGLNLHTYAPQMTVARYEALHGPIPTPENEPALKQFSALMKLEPFQRGMRELAPTVWLTALRKVQNNSRENLNIISRDTNFGTLKVSPVFYSTDAQMESYLDEHNLPNEWDYFDPAKADEKRECGLHAAWGATVLSVPGAQRG